MKDKRIVCFWIAVFLCCLLQPGRVEAAEDIRLHEEGFSADHNLKGLLSSCEEYFRAGDWDIEEAELRLYYTATMLVREEVSDFTVSLNGEPVYSQKIPLTGGEAQELSIPLPKRLIKEGVNSIRLEAYIRTNEEDPCSEDISGASWMVIRKESGISVSYRPAAVCRNVADVYRQLTSIEALENKQSALFLQTVPTEPELTAAAMLMSGISGNAAVDYDNLGLVVTDGLSEASAYEYGVYLCEYERLPADVKALLDEEQLSAGENGAVIAFVHLAGGARLLVVTGQAEALQNACRLFGNAENMEQSASSWRAVSAEEDVSTPSGQAAAVRLTETGSYVSGLFQQTAAFTVSMSASRSIAAGSQAKLFMRYAQNLDFDRSLVTVYLGDVPIGSKKLEKDSANGDVLTVNIPDNLNITGSFQLSVTFDLELKNQTCDIRRQDVPWAYVTNESTVSLRTRDVPWLLFDYYPGPFLHEGRLNNVRVILPVQETKEELEAFRSIMLTLGRYQTDNTGRIEVCRSDRRMDDLGGFHIISIGRYAGNAIARHLNDELYFRFSPDGTTILSNEKMKIEESYGEALGTAQLMYSPYSTEERALLIVSGVTGEGTLKAAAYLGDADRNWQTFGDGYVTDGEQIYCYRFGQDNKRGISFYERLTGQGSVLLLLTAGGCVMMLMGISLLFLWRKHGREK